MKNFDRIRNFDIDQMAEFLATCTETLEQCYCCPAEKFCEGNVAKLGCKGVFKLWLEAEENTEPPKPEKPNMFVSDMVDLDQPKPTHIPTPTWNRMRKEFNKIFEDDTDE